MSTDNNKNIDTTIDYSELFIITNNENDETNVDLYENNNESDQENGELEVLNLSDNNDNNRSESDELDENGEDDKDTEEEHMKNGKDKEELFVNPDVESKNIDENEEEEEEEEEEEKEKDLDVQLDNDGGSRGTVDEDGISQDRNDNEIKKMSQERNDEFNICDLKTSIRSGEQQTKVVSENIEKIENHFPQIVQDINVYTVRSAKLRDAGDNFSKSLQAYAASEVPALRQGLSAFSECFASVQDHRNVLVNRLENKVVQAFTVYETRCKQAKIDVKQHNIAHTKELNEHKSFEKIKAKSTQQFQLAKAETKFKKAAEEANRSAQILNDQITDFERQKIRDLKKVFGDFMLSEMLFYAKALEIYTRAYQELMDVDEDDNIEQLHQSMKFEPHRFGQTVPQYGMYGGSAPTLMQPNPQQTPPQNTSSQSLERTF